VIALAKAYFVVWLLCLFGALCFSAGVATATLTAVAMLKAAS
jgi:hypothetical protein